MFRISPIALILLPFLAPFTPAPAAAETEGRAPRGTLSIQLENDKLVGTDRHYTHGTRVTWTWDDEKRVPEWVSTLLDQAYIFSTPKRKQLGMAFGQNIYTPEDTTATGLLIHDRPYAGWTYMGLSLHAEVDTPFFGRDLTAIDTLEIDFGLVGPQSYARETQNAVHRLIGTDESKGWDNQLENEPTLNLMLERKWRVALAQDLGGADWDTLPYAGASIGNVLTHASMGTMLRFGHELETDYGPPRIQPNLPGRASFDAFENSDRLGWYLFAGAEGRYVAHNLFLDGNTFTSSHSVERNPWTGDIQVGAVVTYGRVRVALTQVHRTREFKGQRQADSFGALTMTLRF